MFVYYCLDDSSAGRVRGDVSFTFHIQSFSVRGSRAEWRPP